MRKIKLPRRNTLLAVLCAVMCLFMLGGWSIAPYPTPIKPDYIESNIDTSSYSDVMTDLQKDSSFNVDEYPAIADDYSIRFIQIAESVNGELFVYTYQPSQNAYPIVANEINMSLTDSVENTTVYGLVLINSNGVFCKYLVRNVTLGYEALRYYNIVSISRAWDKQIDGDPVDENNNTRESVVYKVARRCMAHTVGNNVIYTYDGMDVITVTGKYTGKLRDVYHQGIGYHETIEYYVAFDTDKRIDKLMSAKVSYDVVTYANAEEITARSPRKEAVCRSDKMSSDSYNSWWPGIKVDYTWQSVYSVPEFLKAYNLVKPAEVSDKSWVLIFYHTEGFIQKLGLPYPTDGPGDVTILELSFFTDGQFYDLGVVDNKQTSDSKVDNIPAQSPWDKFLAKVKSLMTKIFGWTNIPDWAAVLFIVGMAIVGIVLLVILVPFLPLIASFIAMCAKGLFYVLSLPIRGIIALIRRKRGNSD